MDVRTYLVAIRKGWWITAVCALLGIAAGAYVGFSATPIYEADLTFYVPPQVSASTNAQSAGEFAQQQAISYAEIVSSERLGRMITDVVDVGLTPSEVASEISGTAPLNTVLVQVAVKDSSRSRALAIARATATEFPKMVNQLDTGGEGPLSAGLAVTSGPRAGTEPISPRKKLDLAVGLVGGLIVGVLLALLRHLLDTSVRTVEELEDAAGVPVIGTVDYDPRARANPLVVGSVARSPRAEAMRRLRTNLQFLDAALPLRSLVVTSAVAGEGKSTIAANLAIVAAESGRRVVLVEADLRRPRTAALLGLDHYVGLTSVLAGLATLDEALQPWGEHDLQVLASGPLPPNPSELLGGATMREVLATLTDRFELVVIDTPPLGPVSDAAALAAEVDGVAVVFRYRKTRSTDLKAAIKALRTVDARIVGVVFNMRKLGRRLRRAYGPYETYGGTGESAAADSPAASRTPELPAAAGKPGNTTSPTAGSGRAAVKSAPGHRQGDGGNSGGRAQAGSRSTKR